MVRRWYGVSGSDEEFDYREFLGSSIEGYVSGKSIEGLYGIGTRDLEDLYTALVQGVPVEDWKKSRGIHSGGKELEGS